MLRRDADAVIGLARCAYRRRFPSVTRGRLPNAAPQGVCQWPRSPSPLMRGTAGSNIRASFAAYVTTRDAVPRYDATSTDAQAREDGFQAARLRYWLSRARRRRQASGVECHYE